MKYIETNIFEGGYQTLNEITDFAFKGGKKDYVTVYSSRAFGNGQKVKQEDLTRSKK